MSGQRSPGVIGSETTVVDSPDNPGRIPPTAGFTLPGPIGVGADALTTVARIVGRVVKDWEPPNPVTSDTTVNGATLEAVANQLDRLPEWGRGGGALRNEAIPPGTSTDVTVNLHANLLLRLPRWTNYQAASPAAKAEWDRMIAKLQIHEQRHVDIAIEEANNLAAALVGREIGEIAGMVTAANRTMQARQDQMDSDTDHGARAGVQYGDVTLDTTIR
jgi:hypothetical protein